MQGIQCGYYWGLLTLAPLGHSLALNQLKGVCTAVCLMSPKLLRLLPPGRSMPFTPPQAACVSPALVGSRLRPSSPSGHLSGVGTCSHVS